MFLNISFVRVYLVFYLLIHGTGYLSNHGKLFEESKIFQKKAKKIEHNL